MLNLKPINVPRAADVLATELRERILRGELGEGAELPPERELCDHAGVSRTTVREALRILEGEGLVATRIGRNGGSAVVKPSFEPIERSLQIFIRGRRIRFEAILETREVIEAPAARYAALHRTDADLAALEACHEQLERASNEGRIETYVRANLDWHVQVVRASHNELLTAFITAIAQPVIAASELKNFNAPDMRSAVLRAHRGVMDAICAQDGDAAERRMKRHVGAYISAVGQVETPESVAPVKAWKDEPRRTRSSRGGHNSVDTTPSGDKQ